MYESAVLGGTCFDHLNSMLPNGYIIPAIVTSAQLMSSGQLLGPLAIDATRWPKQIELFASDSFHFPLSAVGVVNKHRQGGVSKNGLSASP